MKNRVPARARIGQDVTNNFPKSQTLDLKLILPAKRHIPDDDSSGLLR